MFYMQTATRTKQEIAVLERNQELFELYALWRSLPIPILRTMTPEQIYQRLAIDDPQVLELTQIHTQADFGEKYKLDKNTLTDWNKKIRALDPLHEAKGWARNLAKNVVMSLYNHAIRKGNPLNMKLFFQVVNDWEETSKIKQTPGNVTFVFSAIEPKKEEKVDKVKPAKQKHAKSTT